MPGRVISSTKAVLIISQVVSAPLMLLAAANPGWVKAAGATGGSAWAAWAAGATGGAGATETGAAETGATVRVGAS